MEMSGIMKFVSGAPLGVSVTTSNGQDITGTASLAPRPDVVGNPVLPKDQRTFERNFDTSVLRLPAAGTLELRAYDYPRPGAEQLGRLADQEHRNLRADPAAVPRVGVQRVQPYAVLGDETPAPLSIRPMDSRRMPSWVRSRRPTILVADADGD